MSFLPPWLMPCPLPRLLCQWPWHKCCPVFVESSGCQGLWMDNLSTFMSLSYALCVCVCVFMFRYMQVHTCASESFLRPEVDVRLLPYLFFTSFCDTSSLTGPGSPGFSYLSLLDLRLQAHTTTSGLFRGWCGLISGPQECVASTLPA